MPDNNPKSSTPPGAGRFATTHWSVVRAAGRPSSPRYKEALGTLCQTYWFPLYAYLRRQGHNRNQAEEYTQAFFTRLLEKRGLRLADSKRVLAREHMPLGQLFGKYQFGRAKVIIMISKENGTFSHTTIVEWPDRSQTGSGRSNKLPAELQRFWDQPVNWPAVCNLSIPLSIFYV